MDNLLSEERWREVQNLSYVKHLHRETDREINEIGISTFRQEYQTNVITAIKYSHKVSPTKTELVARLKIGMIVLIAPSFSHPGNV